MPRIITLCNHEWYVLEEQGNKMLLLAKYIITRKAYHEIRELTSWGKCTLRKWLNGDFYKSLEECHVNILDTETDQGVTDKIFLLSVEEYRKYNPPTTGWWWWLRSPGLDSGSAADVSDDGGVNFYGIDVSLASGGVRPAMWVDIKMKKGLKLLKSEV